MYPETFDIGYCPDCKPRCTDRGARLDTDDSRKPEVWVWVCSTCEKILQYATPEDLNEAIKKLEQEARFLKRNRKIIDFRSGETWHQVQ